METKDIKLETFLDIDLWKEVIQKSVDKRINRSVLSQLCEIDNRIAFAQLIQSGEYKIAPPRIGLIPKPNSTEMRKVYINTDLDRIVLTLINETYIKLYGNKIHPNCVSYQKGIGVSNIIKNITKKTTSLSTKTNLLGYKVDISKYFDSVNRETLFKALEEVSTNSCIDNIVKKYYNEDLVIDEEDNLINKYKSIAQGCAVSAFLANYILRDVDEALSNLNIIYYRYSDDLLMIGEDADKAMGILETMLSTKGLALNPKKVEKLIVGEWFTFLGYRINGSQVRFSEDSIARFKAKIKEITKMRKGMKVGSRAVQRKAIKDIQYYMYTAFLKSGLNFGWGEYFYNTITVEDDIKMLDEYVKDHLKHMYTGKWNHTTNRNKTSNETLMDLGYVSMVHMYKLFKTNKEVFRAEIRRTMI